MIPFLVEQSKSGSLHQMLQGVRIFQLQYIFGSIFQIFRKTVLLRRGGRTSDGPKKARQDSAQPSLRSVLKGWARKGKMYVDLNGDG